MNRKYQVKFFDFYDVSGIERHLEEMAARGWILESAHTCLWRYRKGRARKVHYAVSYYAGFAQSEPGGLQMYEELCSHSGWKMISGGSKYQIFSSELDDPVAIYTEPDTEIDAIHRAARSNLTLFFAVMLAALLQIGITLFGFIKDPIHTMAYGTGMFAVLLHLSVFLAFGFATVRYFCWRYQAKKGAFAGVFLPTSRLGHHIHYSFLLVALVMLLFVIVSAVEPAVLPKTAVWTAAVLAAAYFAKSVRILLEKQGSSCHKKRISAFFWNLTPAVLLISLAVFGSCHSVPMDRIDFADSMILTAADAVGTEEKTERTSHRNVSSPLLACYTGWEQRKDGKGLSYEILDGGFPWVEQFCRNYWLHQNDRSGHQEEGYDPEHPFYSYRETDPECWNADRAWRFYGYGEPKHSYILQYDSRLVLLEFSWDVSTEQALRVGQILRK